MPKKSSKKRSFKGAVGRNAAKQQKGAQYGHLNLPKGLSVFKEEPKSRVNFDIIPYEVTCANHPDKDDEYGIATKGSLWYKRPYYLHRSIGANNEAVVCPSSIGQKCPICEYREQLLKDGADWKDDTVKALKPSMRNLYLVVPIGNKKFEEDVHLWDISQYLFQDKLNEEIQENEEFEAFPDLEEGYTLKVRFSEETFAKNKYAETSRIDFVERDGAYDEDIMDPAHGLDDLLIVPSYKTLEALFFGGLSQEEVEDEDDDWDDAEEEEEVEVKKTHKKKKAPKKEVEEDDEDIDDEEEDEPVKKIQRKRKAPKKDLDEFKDDDEEDDDEPPFDKEEEPKTKKKTAKKTTAKKKTSAKDKCPFGHKFGTDCEKFDDCDDCDLWDDCIDASE